MSTSHTPQLTGKCFGCVLSCNGERAIYTGDTNKLEDFDEYIEDCTALYVDVSYNYGQVHLKWDDVKEKLFKISENTSVYLMHMDDVEAFKALDFGSKNIKLTAINTKENGHS